MKTKLAAIFIFVALLLTAVAVRSRFAGELGGRAAPPASTPSIAVDPIAAELERLGREYWQVRESLDAAVPPDHHQPADLTLPVQEWLERRRAARAAAPNPDKLLPQFVAFAQRHSRSPLAFDALYFVVRVAGFKEFRDDGQPWPVLEQALEMAWADHRDDPRIVHLLAALRVPSRQSESFLKRALEDPPSRDVRAAATFHLAGYYQMLAACHERSQTVVDKPVLTNDDRFWKHVVTRNIEEYLPLNGEQNSRKVEDLLGQVIADYNDVPATYLERSGRDGMLVHSVPFAPAKTYGDLAAAMLNELTNLIPGKPAPEIVGTDADGNTFRLSDYRGKVVLLVFSADWCPGCVKFYPTARRLQEKYRDQPFVILGVNRNEELNTLKAAIAQGDITWRCWWDGRDGPIYKALNAGAGTLFLLDDQHIIQDRGLSSISFEEEFVRAIEPLLKKAAMRPGASQ
jgi:thiol-disulfide isomerase/thioredoxin